MQQFYFSLFPQSNSPISNKLLLMLAAGLIPELDNRFKAVFRMAQKLKASHLKSIQVKQLEIQLLTLEPLSSNYGCKFTRHYWAMH